MRVGIDVTALTPQHAGVDRYLVNLVAELAVQPAHARYYVFVNREDRPLFADLPAHVTVVALCYRPRIARLLFQQAVLPLAARWLQLDVVHSPSFIMPLLRGRARHVLTVHDLTTFIMPHFHIPLRRSRPFAFAVAHSIRRADLVCTPSEAARADIVQQVRGVRPERVRTVPHGIRACFRPEAAEHSAEVAARLQIPSPYILFLGTIEPRKGLPTLLRAYRQLVDRGHLTEHLVLAGRLGWDYGDVLALAGASRERVHLPGFVPEEALPALLAGARLFVYPSLREGFGFPPLEAMACGVPVIATRTSALAENLESAALLVPLGDVDALAEAMHRALRDDELRRRMRADGLARAARFTWQNTARAHIAVYREALERDA